MHFSRANTLKRNSVKFWLNFINKFQNTLSINKTIHTVKTSERLRAPLGVKNSTLQRHSWKLASLHYQKVPERITRCLLDSTTSITSASHRMASVIFLLSIVNSTQMFYSSSGVDCWDFAALIAENLEYFFVAVDGKSRERNFVIRRVVLQKLSILKASW